VSVLMMPTIWPELLMSTVRLYKGSPWAVRSRTVRQPHHRSAVAGGQHAVADDHTTVVDGGGVAEDATGQRTQVDHFVGVPQEGVRGPADVMDWPTIIPRLLTDVALLTPLPRCRDR
jgi:hypothetical protein